MNKLIYKNLIAFHPGYYLKDIIDCMDMTQDEFAKRLNTTSKTISKLLNGEIPLSKNLAENLALMMGTSVSVWLNLQNKYDEKCCEISCRKKIDKEKEILKMFDYSYFEDLNVVSSTKNDNQRVSELCTLFKVSSLSILEKPDLLTACKTSVLNIKTKNVVNANAWIQLGENFARKIVCNDYSQKRLMTIIPKLRNLTLEHPSIAFNKLRESLADCGIILVTLPYLRDSALNGAIKWLNSNKVMLLINDRGKDIAIFWFTIFHEIKHILQKRIKSVYLTSKNEDKTILSLGRNVESEEKEADEFAQNQLIPQSAYNEFVRKQNFSLLIIKSFADNIGISVGIVIRRLKHDKYIKWSMFNNQNIKYDFKK
ncbi:MAG: HigA family addiction module antidote protein [Selenomonadaceae bacterium]|nr:HigA family addiction module antidote protein [Selenomonadaceae bacterium]MBR1730709.1 HigA family addiction module antidote protein [Selenomonadaceae bacterium]